MVIRNMDNIEFLDDTRRITRAMANLLELVSRLGAANNLNQITSTMASESLGVHEGLGLPSDSLARLRTSYESQLGKLGGLARSIPLNESEYVSSHETLARLREQDEGVANFLQTFYKLVPEYRNNQTPPHSLQAAIDRASD